MVSLDVALWGLVLLFGLIGSLRGWAKEVIVAFSVLLSLFTQQVVGQYILGPGNPYVPVLLSGSPEAAGSQVYSETQFYVGCVLVLVLTFFGYAGPTLVTRARAKVARERLQDSLLGFFLGMLNGYLIAGMLWFYLDRSKYVFIGIDAPLEGSTAWAIAQRYLLPLWLTTPMLYLAIALAFVFVIIVFV